MSGVPLYREDQAQSPDVPAGAAAQYSATLTNNADSLSVSIGPGATTVLVNIDVLVRDVGQSGVPGNQRGYDATVNVSSEFPLLNPANYESGFDFGPFFTQLAAKGYTFTQPQKEEIESDVEKDIDAQLAKEGFTMPLSQAAASAGAPAAPSGQAAAAPPPPFSLKASTAQYAASTCADLTSTDQHSLKRPEG